MIVGRLLQEAREIAEHAICEMPGSAGRKLRRAYYGRRLKRLGRKATMSPGIEIVAPENISIGNDFLCTRRCFLGAPEGGVIEIGDNVSFASNVVIDAGTQGVIKIGDNSGVAHNCVLRSTPHRYDEAGKPFKEQGHKPGSIVIEDNVWVAANCTLVKGTHLKSGCIVAAGSVVGGTFEPDSLIAGNPARVIGKRGG